MITDVKELKKVREDNNISQADLAGVVGLHASAIGRIESGNVDCRISTIQLLNEGIETILKSRFTGFILKNETDFKNTAYRALIKELQSIEASGKYKGNSHHLTQRLVELLLTEFKVKPAQEKT